MGEWLFAGSIVEWQGDDAIFELRNYINGGEFIEFLIPNGLDNLRLVLTEFEDAETAEITPRVSAGQGKKIRIRPNGSSGGHKGIQSIINNLGTKDVKRVRIGIDKVSSDKTVDYVIGNFSKQDREIIDISIEKGINILEDFIRLPFEQVMSRYN